MKTANSPTPVLDVREITVHFGGITALSNVTISVPPGARYGILGPNGAGKTTLYNVISGFIRPATGRVMVDGIDVTSWPAHRRVRQGLARTFQITTLFPALTALENVMMGTLAQLGHHNNFWRPARRDRAALERAVALLDELGLGDLASAPVRELSYGQQRQLEVALALATRPRLLLLDEPTAGLSAAETHSVCQLVGRLPAELTVVIIEHDLDVIFEIADYISVLHQGERIAEGPSQVVQRDPVVKEVYLGGR